MCFNIHSKYGDSLLAKEDITCFKILRHSFGRLTAPFADADSGGVYIYNIDEVKTESIGRPYLLVIDKIARHSIERGLHSFTNVRSAVRYRSFGKPWRTYFIYKCVIPKGSAVYYNPWDHQYVSNSIRVVGRASWMEMFIQYFRDISNRKNGTVPGNLQRLVVPGPDDKD